MQIRITITLPAAEVFRQGLPQALEGMTLNDSGSIVVPVHYGAYTLNQVAPCGTWELVDD